jgi:predicted regulator of Ras-like GTPase activity (Roadblock/LC7/MglB family)
VSTFHETLVELRQAPGIKGAAVVTPDGLIVAHSLEARFRDDVVAGLTSFLVMTTDRCLREGQMEGMTQITLQATNGKVVFTNLDTAWMVVLLDQFADLENCRSEINQATLTLRRHSRLA